MAARTQDATDSAKASAQSTADKASAKVGEVREGGGGLLLGSGKGVLLLSCHTLYGIRCRAVFLHVCMSTLQQGEGGCQGCCC
jgi:hypothetical protein